jgi:carboxymethylenebutenolidase
MFLPTFEEIDMRKPLFFLIGAVAAGIGAVSARSAVVVDEHADHGGESTIAVRTQQPSALPASGAEAAARVAASPRRSEWVIVKAGADSVAAWIVYPQRTEKAPVVVVLHENMGLNVWTRGVADQLAAEGFVAIAPDMTTMSRTGDLRSDPTQDEGRAGIRAVTNEKVQTYLDAAAAYAMALPEALPKYGVVGFCWGGQRSFLHAVHAPTLGAAVVYYGVSPTNEQLASVRAPVLGLYGGNDARVNNTIPAADSTMKRLGKPYEHAIFEGAGHGFLRAQEGANGANLKATQEAWPKTVAFFKQHLGA